MRTGFPFRSVHFLTPEAAWRRSPLPKSASSTMPSRSTAPTTSSSTSAMPSRPVTIYRSAFGFQLVALLRPGDRRARPRQLPAAAGQDPPRPDDADRRPTRRSPSTCFATATASRTIALWVDDARDGVRDRRSSAAPIPVREPAVLRDDDGEIVIAAIGTYGDTIHSLVERRNYRGRVPARLSRRRRRTTSRPTWAQVRRPLRGQCRARAR